MNEPTLLTYLDSVLLVALLGGMVHVLVSVGEMKTKINTMWEWWIKNNGGE